MKNFCLEPSTFKLDGGAMFGIIPKPLWEKKAPADEHNRISLSLRLWAIETQDKLILIDTGIGDYHDQKFVKNFDVNTSVHPLNRCLKEINRSVADVTDLILSHLHFDHVGGIATNNGNNFVSCFPNSTIHLHFNHYQYALNPTKRDSGSFHPHVFEPVIQEHLRKNQLKFVDKNEGRYDIEGVDIRYITSSGHTPFLCHPYNEQYIYLTDIIPTSAHLPTAWVMGYDISPGQSCEDKERILDFCYEKNLKVIFEHDPHIWGGELQKDEKGKFSVHAPENFKISPLYSID